MKLYAQKGKKYYKYIPTEESYEAFKDGSRASSGCQSAGGSSTQIYGGANAYEVGQNHYFNISYTYNNPIPATTYTFRVQIGGQGNGYINSTDITITYDDDSTQQVYYLAAGRNSLNETFTFTATKPIKKIVGSGRMTHTSSQYVGVNLYLSSISHIVDIIETGTEEDHDFSVDILDTKVLYTQNNNKYWLFNLPGNIKIESTISQIINYSETITQNATIGSGRYYIEIVGAGGRGSYGQAGYWQERYGGGSGARWSAVIEVSGSHIVSMTCGGSLGSSSTLTIDGVLVATAGGGGTPTAGAVTAGNTSITGVTFSSIESKAGNQGGYTFTVEGTSTGNAASVASRGTYGQGSASGNGIGEAYNWKAGWIYLQFISPL